MSKKQNLMDKFSNLGDSNVVPITGAVIPEAPAEIEAVRQPTRATVTLPSVAGISKPSLAERLKGLGASPPANPEPPPGTEIVSKPRGETPIAKRLQEMALKEATGGQEPEKKIDTKTEAKVDAEPVAKAETKAVSKTTNAPKPANGTFRLYVNCRPLRVATVDGNDIVDLRTALDGGTSATNVVTDAIASGEIKKGDHVVLTIGHDVEDDELYSAFVRHATDVVSGR